MKFDGDSPGDTEQAHVLICAELFECEAIGQDLGMATGREVMGQLARVQQETGAQQDFAGVREARDKTSCKPDSRNTTVMTPAW